MKLSEVFHEVLQPGQSARTASQVFGQMTRQGLAVMLSALMLMVPMGQSTAFAQELPGAGQAPPPAADNGQQATEQPLGPDQLSQLVAPIALYPDALVAQVLAASTYPTQVVEADRWRQSQGNAPADQIAAGADGHNWDASVKALTAFPTVLSQMDKNLQWTTDLGNAYYNQPQDVMDAVQGMRQKAQNAGNLRSTPQQTVTAENGAIAIAPANPTVVYVPVYDPWTVWGSPYPPYPGFYYGPPAGIFWGGLAIGFGVGIGIGLWGHWGWGWGHWGMGWGPRWGGRGVFYNHNTYITRSSTVINHGYGRPGGPPRSFAGTRGSFARPGARPGGAGGFNRAGGAAGRPNGGSFNRGASNNMRPGGSVSRPGGSMANRPAGGSFNRSGASAPRANTSRGGASAPRSSGGGGGRSGGGAAHASGGHASGGGGGHHGK
jgi:hypothetical protein